MPTSWSLLIPSGAFLGGRHRFIHILLTLNVLCRGRRSEDEFESLGGSGNWRPHVMTCTHLKEKRTTKKPLFYVTNVTFCLRVEECRPGIGGDDIIRLTLTDMRSYPMREVHQCRPSVMHAAHVASSQLYSMGHKRHPVSSLSKPRPNLEVGGRGADKGLPSIPDIQLTTAGFRLAASSPLAPPDTFLSYTSISPHFILRTE